MRRCSQKTSSSPPARITTPGFPPFARELDESIVQLHSKEYRNPSQVRTGGVLVVGAGNSGAEIAIELSREHQVWLSGRDTGQEPTRAGSLPDQLFTHIMWFMATTVLTVKTPIGRKVRDHFLDPPRGIPLGRVRRKDFAAAGIERVPRVSGVSNGFPSSRMEGSSRCRTSSGAPDSRRTTTGSISLFPRTTACPFTIAASSALSRSLPHGAPLPLLPELGAGRGRRTGCRVHRRSHQFQVDRSEWPQ